MPKTQTPPAPSATSRLTAEARDLGDLQYDRLSTVVLALYAEAGGTPIDADTLPVLSLLGDEAAIRRERGRAFRGYRNVQRFHETADAEKLAKAAREKLEREAPAIRDQIAKLQQQLGELERAPVQHEANAQSHVEATKQIRVDAPQHVRQRHTALSRSIDPLRQKRAAAKTELHRLKVMTTIDPTHHNNRHHVENERNPDGSRPWLLEDMHGRRVCDPSLWAIHLNEIRAEERIAELEAELPQLNAEVEKAEAEIDKTLDFWLTAPKELA